MLINIYYNNNNFFFFFFIKSFNFNIIIQSILFIIFMSLKKKINK